MNTPLTHHALSAKLDSAKVPPHLREIIERGSASFTERGVSYALAGSAAANYVTRISPKPTTPRSIATDEPSPAPATKAPGIATVESLRAETDPAVVTMFRAPAEKPAPRATPPAPGQKTADAIFGGAK